jgi:hypothetical protein
MVLLRLQGKNGMSMSSAETLPVQLLLTCLAGDGNVLAVMAVVLWQRQQLRR